MKNILKYAGLCGLALLPMTLSAQTISFETQDYKALGVYDTWEASPFRTGELAGNVAVVDNHLADAESNETQKILAVQRSRFGSNTFGVKIDLNETFELTPAVKYAHVMIHKPTSGRVMLIGLGKRTDRPEQSNEVEQFWAYPMNDLKTGEWFDAVFPIKGNGGIDIYSLVLVPDCETPTVMSQDFVAYVDEIVINNDMKPRVGLGNYPVNFASDSGWGRDDRKINGVNLSGGSDGSQSIAISDSDRKGYMVMFDTPFKAKAGDNVTPTFTYEGTWVHGYVYLDRDGDGQFSYGTDANNNLDTSTDLVSYSWYRSGDSGAGKNSAGSTINDGNNNVLNPPAFTIPSNLTPGIYRMRYKVDWNNIDPAGNVSAGNNILANGGGVVDVLLNIHGDEVSVTQDNRNGEVLVAATGQSINNDRIPFGQDFKIKMNPSNGFEYNGIRVRHGYNLSGDSLIKDNPQYRDTFFYIDEFGSDDTFTIPGSVIDGDVLIEGLFVEQGTGLTRTAVTYNVVLDGRVVYTKDYQLMPGSDYPEISLSSEASAEYYTITGFPEGKVPEEDQVIELTLVQNLPFQPSAAINDETVWYNLAISADNNLLSYSASQTYIDLGSSVSGGTANAQWAFIGDVLNGFKIVNRAAGEGYVLSAPTSITGTNDGTVYAIMRQEPVDATCNTYWVPTKSSDISGGFYLHQLGITKNRMNKRDGRLAFWVGGADGGSTFTLSIVDEMMPDIDYCEPTPVNGRSVSGGRTNRTDRYLTEAVLSDGTSSVTLPGGGTNSGRNVYVDRTSVILNTEPGKTVTVACKGGGYWVNTFLYVDFDQNGFTVDDRVYSNFGDNPDTGNIPTLDFNFEVPQGTPTGYYRARFIHDWENTDPCYYGQSGSDNGELVLDFYVKVTAYGTVTYSVEGNGSIEGWTKVDDTCHPAEDATAISDGDVLATGGKSKAAFIFIPDTDANGDKYSIISVVINNGADESYSFAENAADFVEMDVDDTTSKYHKALCYKLAPLAGNVQVAASFSLETSAIGSIVFDPADGPVEIYNLQGVRMSADNLANGFYILRQGKKVAKVYIAK